jgi:hypothetical protein
LKVTIRSAELVPGRGILVRGLAVVEPDAEGPRAELVHAEEVFITCPTDLDKLVQGEPEVRRIVFRRPTFHNTRRPDGSWSLARLQPRTVGKKLPEMRVESGLVEVFDPLKNPSSSLTYRDVNLTFKPSDDSATPCDDSTKNTSTTQARPTPADTARQCAANEGLSDTNRADAARLGGPDSAGPRTCSFQGTLAGDMLRQVEVSGTVDLNATDPSKSKWTLAGTADGLELSPDLHRTLPEPWATRLIALRPLRGQARVEFHVEYDPDKSTPLRFRYTGQLSRGRLEDPRLPRPLTDMRGLAVGTEEGITVERLVARCGRATLQLSGRRSGYEERSPVTLKGEIRELELDQELMESLPESLREQWHRFLPTGEVNADVSLAYDGQTWRPELAIRCVNVAFTSDKFPYRLDNGQGTLELKDDVLAVKNLTAYGAGQPVRISLRMLQPLTSPHGWVEAKGENIPVDEKLVDAIPGKARAAIRSMDPRGTINFFARAWRDSPGEPFHRHVPVGLNRAAIRYEKFPYQISNIRGTLEMRDGDWAFRDLEGSHGAGRLTGDGRLTSAPDGSCLALHLTGTGIPLEAELRDALKPGMQQVWNNLQPQGIVDLGVDISYLSGQDRFAVNLRAEPRSENASIKPNYFPYRLENLQGVLTYRDGRVTLERFRGEHGNTRVSSGGQCDFYPDGSWRLDLTGLDVERLRLDRELAAALPGRLRRVISEINPIGAVQLNGTFALAQGGKAGDPLKTEWNLAVGFQQGSIDFGLRLDNLNGEVRLAGACDGDRFSSRGELALDSAMFRDFQFTQVAGPVWIDDDRILFGTWVDRPTSSQSPAPEGGTARPPRPIVGRLFGGNVVCDGYVVLGSTPRYALSAKLAQAELGRCAQETGSKSHDLRGTVHAQLQLHGSGRSLNLLGGHGKIELSDADIYELPLMMALLKMLRTRRPDRSAFSSSDIDFRVEGNHIYFDRIKFTGDAISLVGEGEMNLQSDIRLKLHAMVGRGERDLPLVHDLFSATSQQIMVIHVGGTLQNPETSREPFPGLARALQQLQPDRDPDSERRLPRKR